MEPGWRTTKAKMDRFTGRLREMVSQLDDDTALVFLLLDNWTLMALTKEGILIPARLGQD